MPNDTYNASNSRRSDSPSLVYDSKTQKWVKKSAQKVPNADKVIDTGSNTNKDSEVNSKGEADKEYIEQEYNTLEGDVEVIPNEKTIRIQTGNTVNLLGFGKVLSGKYYVSGVKRTITKDEGYSNSLTVMKNGFSDSLKKLPDSSARTEVVK